MDQVKFEEGGFPKIWGDIPYPFNNTYKEKLFYSIQYKKDCWLLLTFLICLHNQLSSIY